MNKLLPAALLAFVAGSGAAGCHPQDIDPLEQQPKFKPYQENEFFSDRRAMRTPPEGTISREHDFGDAPPISAELLELGKRKYEATCAACHGLAGDGNSTVARKMVLRAPPTLHDDRLRAVEAGYLYNVVTEGYGIMPRYSTALDAHERWAVVAYVRALQLSQHLPIGEAPADVRQAVESAKAAQPAPEGAKKPMENEK
jgi:mono/diheme cytochrome c family protein